MSLLNFLSGNSEQSPIGTYIIFGVIIVIIIFMYVSQNKQRKKQMAERSLTQITAYKKEI